MLYEIDTLSGRRHLSDRPRGAGTFASAFRGMRSQAGVILCAVTYDPKTKRHTCKIER